MRPFGQSSAHAPCFSAVRGWSMGRNGKNKRGSDENRESSDYGMRLDPVARKKMTGGVKHTTVRIFHEGFGEWAYGQPPHVFKVVTDKKRRLQPDGEPYWRWECKCGDSRGGYKSERTALSKGDSHSIHANKGKSKPLQPESPADLKPFDAAAAERVLARREGKMPEDEARSIEAKRQSKSRRPPSAQASSDETFNRDAAERVRGRREKRGRS